MTEPIEDDSVLVHVGIEISEAVVYYLKTVVWVPREIADDPDALNDLLREDEGLWLDELDANKHCDHINERDVLNVSILNASPATDDTA